MRARHLIAAGLILAAGAAQAQVAALGSTATGGTSQIGRTMAAAISEGSSLQIRPQELANTADYIPLVNAGELEFGISNVVQLYYAVTGTGMSEGRPNANLRMVATLMPFRNGYIVRRDSGIDSIADLAGKRAPVFSEGALGDYITKAYLANAGLSEDDVEGVAVPNFPRMWASFGEGSTDVTIVVVGAGNSREYDATMGIKYLSYDDSPEALAAMREYLPQAYLQTLDVDSGIPGILGADQRERLRLRVLRFRRYARRDGLPRRQDPLRAGGQALGRRRRVGGVRQGPDGQGRGRRVPPRRDPLLRGGRDLGPLTPAPLLGGLQPPRPPDQGMHALDPHRFWVLRSELGAPCPGLDPGPRRHPGAASPIGAPAQGRGGVHSAPKRRPKRRGSRACMPWWGVRGATPPGSAVH